MKLPQLIDEHVDACSFLKRWGISEGLACKLFAMADRLEFGISIISGYRTKEEQDGLRRAGRPAADDDRSTHRSFPATGADLRPAIYATYAVKARFGAEAVAVGLRWGGGSPIQPLGSDEPGIPEDWQHVDLGPRR